MLKTIIPFKAFAAVILVLSCIFLFCSIINVYMVLSTNKYVFKDKNDIPQKYTTMILGAMVYPNDIVSHVVRDRIYGAMELYQCGKTSKILITGDHGQKRYDEVNTMRKYIMKYFDINEENIFMDHAGFTTYESMYRARDIFEAKDIIIVTQSFHVNRSLYIARKLGIDAVAYVAPEVTPYAKYTRIKWFIREYFARVKAFISVAFDAKPTYLGEKIFINGDGRNSWD